MLIAFLHLERLMFNKKILVAVVFVSAIAYTVYETSNGSSPSSLEKLENRVQLENDNQQLQSKSAHQIQTMQEKGNLIAISESDLKPIIQSDKDANKVLNEKIGILIAKDYQALQSSGYLEYEREQLETMALNGDGLAALGYINSFVPFGGGAFSGKVVGENRLKLIEMAHIAIRSNLMLGYFTASSISQNQSTKFAYLMIAAEDFKELSPGDFRRVLETENFYPEPNLDEVEELVFQLRQDI